MSSNPVTTHSIERNIHQIRGHRVMIDVDLAQLYGVTTSALNRQVKRNQERFPEDFMFQLNKEEADSLSDERPVKGRGGRRRSQPYAFTEHGVVMLSSVLSSARAVAVNIQVVRVFVRLRHAAVSTVDMARRLAQLEAEVLGQKSENSKHFKLVFEALRKLMDEQDERQVEQRGKIGFAID